MSLSVNDIVPYLAFCFHGYIAQQKKLKSLLPDTIFGLKMYPKCFCDRGFTLKPAVALFPRPPNFAAGKGGRGGRKMESRAMEERGREGGEGKGEGKEGGAGKEGREGRGKAGRGLV